MRKEENQCGSVGTDRMVVMLPVVGSCGGGWGGWVVVVVVVVVVGGGSSSKIGIVEGMKK